MKNKNTVVCDDFASGRLRKVMTLDMISFHCFLSMRNPPKLSKIFPKGSLLLSHVLKNVWGMPLIKIVNYVITILEVTRTSRKLFEIFEKNDRKFELPGKVKLCILGNALILVLNGG